MNDQQRQHSFDRAQASYDNMSPDDSDGPEGDCPECGESTGNFDIEQDEEGTHCGALLCDDCKPLEDFRESPEETIEVHRAAAVSDTKDGQIIAEINEIHALALDGLKFRKLPKEKKP